MEQPPGKGPKPPNIVPTATHREINEELVRRILSYLMPEPTDFLSQNNYPYHSLRTTLLSYSSSQRNLRNVSLACKRLRDITRPILFTNVQLHNHKQLYCLFRTLLERPDLGRHIVEEQELCEMTLGTLLCLTVNLGQLVIELVNPQPSDSDDWQDDRATAEVWRLALLTDIMASALAERDKFPGFLTKLHTFQLRLFGTFLYRHMPDIVSHLAEFPQLHSVELAGALVGGTHSNPYFESLFACKNLTRLEIGFSDPLGVRFFQPDTPIKTTLTRLLNIHKGRLNRVSLTWWHYNLAQGDMDLRRNLISHSHAVDGIDAISRLEHLEIDLHCLFGRSFVWSRLPDVLALRITEALPRSLKSLCLFEVWRDLPFHLDVRYSDEFLEKLGEHQRSVLEPGRGLLKTTRALIVDRVLFDLYKNLEYFPALKTIGFVPIQYRDPDDFAFRQLHHYELIFKLRGVEFKTFAADRLTRMKWRPEVYEE
ncbi:hypothetical protein B0T22DRAFT_510731 [Podospora appendiculata]|uniref:Uncharacterized protein n=1 Tax=Podospora appendiculata TaxID=314037 RepID=A0AAE0X8L3_9PEZI|nr:hypothetical protein B0T22DRAFT_510731 [Podospora appendiculata]